MTAGGGGGEFAWTPPHEATPFQRATDLPALFGNPLLDERLRLGLLGRDDPRRQQLVRRYAYGIPDDAVLGAIALAAPFGVVEVGAGTGYWARLLHDRGVAVVAYDVQPPHSGANRFVDAGRPWFPVGEADERAVEQHPERTLLLVWPTWRETWAGDAAARFHAVGGRTLVYVGDGPGGRTGDATLHARLGIHGPCLPCTLGVLDQPCVCGIAVLWRRVRTIAVPRWAGADDVCGIYVRTDSQGHRRSWHPPRPARNRSSNTTDQLNIPRLSADIEPGGSDEMSSEKPSIPAKAGFGAACAVCCAFPILVVTGSVSVAALAVVSIAAAAIVTVAIVTWAFSTDRLPALGRGSRTAIALFGVIVAAYGLAIDISTSSGRSLVTIGVALLTTAAMLALARVRSEPAGP